MMVRSFNRVRTSLLRAENRCINHLNELAIQGQPKWDDIHQGYLYFNELKDIHSEALDAYPFYAFGTYGKAMAALLRSSALTMSQALLLLEELARKYHRIS